jgi:hypothetical protein
MPGHGPAATMAAMQVVLTPLPARSDAPSATQDDILLTMTANTPVRRRLRRGLRTPTLTGGGAALAVGAGLALAKMDETDLAALRFFPVSLAPRPEGGR